MKLILDNRHRVNLEFCGHTKPRHVTRFCSNFIGSYETRKEAFDAFETFEKVQRAKL